MSAEDPLLDDVVYEIEKAAGYDGQPVVPVARSVLDLVRADERDRIIADLVAARDALGADALDLAVHAVRGTL